jgi:lysylphosphatidylglycerol synthetase-like protein (DUF2156 family)
MGVAMMAASQKMVAFAEQRKWVSMRFGTERVLDPATNGLVQGTKGKRTATKCNQLLKSGVKAEVYSPSTGQYDPELENELARIYEEWREARNQKDAVNPSSSSDEQQQQEKAQKEEQLPAKPTKPSKHQTYITVFDMLSLPRLMTFLITRDPKTKAVTGFAALRRLGGELGEPGGFHIDPFISTPSAPKGTTDLLLFATMALCRDAGISNLSLGFEPSPGLGEISGMSTPVANITRSVHKQVFGQIGVGGKAEFHKRFGAEDGGGLYMIFVGKWVGVRSMVAMMGFANINFWGVVRDGLRDKLRREREKEEDVDAGKDAAGKGSKQDYGSASKESVASAATKPKG